MIVPAVPELTAPAFADDLQPHQISLIFVSSESVFLSRGDKINMDYAWLQRLKSLQEQISVVWQAK